MVATTANQHTEDFLQIIGSTTCNVLQKMVHIDALVTTSDKKNTSNKNPVNISDDDGNNQLIASIEFSGDISGKFSLWVDRDIATDLAAQMYGIAKEKLPNTKVVDDAIGEIANVIVGNSIASLYFNNLEVGITPPNLQTPNINVKPSDGKYTNTLNILINEMANANFRITVNDIKISPKQTKDNHKNVD